MPWNAPSVAIFAAQSAVLVMAASTCGDDATGSADYKQKYSGDEGKRTGGSLRPKHTTIRIYSKAPFITSSKCASNARDH